MPKLPRISGKEALRAFSKAGFTVVRVAGSHYIMEKTGQAHVLSVPVHAGEDLKSGTLRSLIRGAGLTIEQFVEPLK